MLLLCFRFSFFVSCPVSLSACLSGASTAPFVCARRDGVADGAARVRFSPNRVCWFFASVQAALPRRGRNRSPSEDEPATLSSVRWGPCRWHPTIYMHVPCWFVVLRRDESVGYCEGPKSTYGGAACAAAALVSPIKLDSNPSELTPTILCPVLVLLLLFFSSVVLS